MNIDKLKIELDKVGLSYPYMEVISCFVWYIYKGKCLGLSGNRLVFDLNETYIAVLNDRVEVFCPYSPENGVSIGLIDFESFINKFLNDGEFLGFTFYKSNAGYEFFKDYV